MARKISLVLAALLLCVQRTVSQFVDPEMFRRLA
jgi:hypothetical protein